MHLDEELLQRLRHGEMTADVARSAREHVASCIECGRRLAEAEREEAEVHALLRQLDHAAPVIDPDTISAVARARVPVGRESRTVLRWAAGFALAASIAGAAWAIPGSPLPLWARALTDWVAGVADPGRARTGPADAAGISVPPGDGLIVRFDVSQPEGRARIDWTDGPEVVVRAPAGAATFTFDSERLAIHNRDASADFEILIPRDAPRVEIHVASRRVFLKAGTRVVAEPRAGNGPPFEVPLTPR